MKLLILSDLHVEFAPFEPNPVAVAAADVVVLAGDIHVGTDGLSWARQAFGEDKPIIYVAGNHEFYGGHWDRTLEELRRVAENLGIHFLENDSVVLHNVRLLGCALWADFLYFGEHMRRYSELDYERGLMDCRRIKADPLPALFGAGHRFRRLTALHVRKRSAESLAWLAQALGEDFDGATVVVTHHLPSRRSVADRYLDDRLTPGFVTLVPEILIKRAALWVHGHTHDSMDYSLGQEAGTRVICNPRGYAVGSLGFENMQFQPGMLIEVG